MCKLWHLRNDSSVEITKCSFTSITNLWNSNILTLPPFRNIHISQIFTTNTRVDVHKVTFTICGIRTLNRNRNAKTRAFFELAQINIRELFHWSYSKCNKFGYFWQENMCRLIYSAHCASSWKMHTYIHCNNVQRNYLPVFAKQSHFYCYMRTKHTVFDCKTAPEQRYCANRSARDD